MRLNDFPLATLQGLGRRRLWWTRRPTRATGASAVPTNMTAVGGQASRPKVATLAFQLPPVPSLAPLGRLAAVGLGLGLVWGLALALRPALAGRGAPTLRAPLPVGAAPASAPRPLVGGVGVAGAWVAPLGRPLPLAVGGRMEATAATALAVAAPAAGRHPAGWGSQARLYAAAWVGARDALMSPTLGGRGAPASAAVAPRVSPLAAPVGGVGTGVGGGAKPGVGQAQPQWRPLPRPRAAQWRL